ncbi:MAG TPA: MFS transporter [Tepidisphaeraceae bacterium]|jgi:ACS family tartrate transporter-like MFS transporter
MTQQAAPMTEESSLVIARIVRRLIPFLCLLFIVNYVDRTNVAMAKLRMLADTGIDEGVYGLGAGLFFIGYFIFEVPSNLILERVGARIWITRIMISWGLICAAMIFVRGPVSFFSLRFALGVAEAGFFPGIVLYLTYWIPSSHRSGVMAWFLTSTAIAGFVGNPLAGALMKLDGVGGLHGWQWVFLVEGIAPVLIGIVTPMLLTDRPSRARWLTPTERDWIEQELARDEQAHSHHHIADLRRALGNSRLWLLSILYFTLIMGLYGFIYWVPSIIQSTAPRMTEMTIGLFSAIPYSVAAIGMVLIGRHSDHRGERRWHIAVCALIGAAGICLVTLCHSTPMVLLALCLAAIGIWGYLGPFWSLTTRCLRGGAAAGGIAIVNSIGALAGFVSPSIIGWAKRATGSFTVGLLVVAGSLVCSAILVIIVPKALDRSVRLDIIPRPS